MGIVCIWHLRMSGIIAVCFIADVPRIFIDGEFRSPVFSLVAFGSSAIFEFI